MGEMNISAQNNTFTFPLPIQLVPRQTTFPARKEEYMFPSGECSLTSLIYLTIKEGQGNRQTRTHHLSKLPSSAL